MARIKNRSYAGVLPDEPGEAGGTFYDGPVPPAGMYRLVVKQLKIKGPNKNGDDMVNCVLEVTEPEAKGKAKGKGKDKFNGYGVWMNQNISEQGAPYLASFLKAIGYSYEEFIKNVSTDDKGLITKIGSRRLPSSDIFVTAVTKREEYDGEERLVVSRFVVKEADDEDLDDLADEDEDEDEDIEDEDEDDDDDEDEDEDEESEEDDESEDEDDEDESDDDEDDEDDEDESDEEESDEDEGEDAGEFYAREDLEKMSMADMKRLLKDEYGWSADDYNGYSRADLIATLAGENAEGEDESEDEPPF